MSFNRWKRWSEEAAFARILAGLAAEEPEEKTAMIDATYLPANNVLREKIARRLTRPVGRPFQTKVKRFGPARGDAVGDLDALKDERQPAGPVPLAPGLRRGTDQGEDHEPPRLLRQRPGPCHSPVGANRRHRRPERGGMAPSGRSFGFRRRVGGCRREIEAAKVLTSAQSAFARAAV